MVTPEELKERLLKLVAIADGIINSSKTMPAEIKQAIINYHSTINHLLPSAYNKASIKQLESDFLIYWNEGTGTDIEKFWAEVTFQGLDVKRKDLLMKVLKKKKITNQTEYDFVIDNLVVSQQLGRINAEEVMLLNNCIGTFEAKQPKNK